MGELVKVDKRIAKKAFYFGLPILFIPNKTNPDNVYGIGNYVRISEINQDFEQFVNQYAYYNCNNELGKTVAYYMTPYRGFHITFTDGSNPYLSTNKDYKTVLKDLEKWSETFVFISVTDKDDIIYITVEERNKRNEW